MRSIKEIKDIAASGRNYTNWDLVLQLACDGSLTKDKLDSIVTDAIGIATNKSVKEVSREGEKDRDQMIIDSIRARDNRIKVLEEALKELVKDTELNKEAEDDYSEIECTLSFTLNGNAFRRLIEAIKTDPLLWAEVKDDLIQEIKELEARLRGDD